MKLGIYRDLSNKDYHAALGISKSGLDIVAKCPALYKARYIDGVKTEPTKAMIIGSATHKAILEPDQFGDEFVVAPKINKRTNAGKEEWATFQADNAGKDVLAVGDYDTIMMMADSARNHPYAKNILARGQAETSIFHEDAETGELVKVRPDWLVDDFVVDVKTAQSAAPDEFSKHCFNFRYFVQAPFYMDVAGAALDRPITNFVFIVIEKTPPYPVAVFFADQEMVNLGRDEYMRNLELYSKCKKNNEWPGYNNGLIEPVGLPYWAANNLKKEKA